MVAWKEGYVEGFAECISQEVRMAKAMKADGVPAILTSPTERDRIRAMIDAENDHLTLMNEARREGIDIGIDKGQTLANTKVVKAMKADGLPVEKIVQCSGFSLAEIEKLYLQMESLKRKGVS